MLSAEACLAPIAVYAEQARLMSAVRITSAIPENNIATAMMPMSFPIKREFRFPTNRRMAFDLNKGGMRLKVWTSNSTTTQQVRLPADEIAARAYQIYKEGQVPMRPTRLLLVSPEDAEGHYKAKEAVRELMHKKWVENEYPPYYRYRPPYRECWNFMSLPKFAAGRIHQMRANKSHLMAQTSWANRDRDPTCPRCGWEPETMKHTVECPALAHGRTNKAYGTFDIEPDSELWKNTKKGRGLMKDFSAYIMENRINFPAGIGVFPFTRNADLAS